MSQIKNHTLSIKIIAYVITHLLCVQSIGYGAFVSSKDHLRAQLISSNEKGQKRLGNMAHALASGEIPIASNEISFTPVTIASNGGEFIRPDLNRRQFLKLFAFVFAGFFAPKSKAQTGQPIEKPFKGHRPNNSSPSYWDIDPTVEYVTQKIERALNRYELALEALVWRCNLQSTKVGDEDLENIRENMVVYLNDIIWDYQRNFSAWETFLIEKLDLSPEERKEWREWHNKHGSSKSYKYFRKMQKRLNEHGGISFQELGKLFEDYYAQYDKYCDIGIINSVVKRQYIPARVFCVLGDEVSLPGGEACRPSLPGVSLVMHEIGIEKVRICNLNKKNNVISAFVNPNKNEVIYNFDVARQQGEYMWAYVQAYPQSFSLQKELALLRDGDCARFFERVYSRLVRKQFGESIKNGKEEFMKEFMKAYRLTTGVHELAHFYQLWVDDFLKQHPDYIGRDVQMLPDVNLDIDSKREAHSYWTTLGYSHYPYLGLIDILGSTALSSYSLHAKGSRLLMNDLVYGMNIFLIHRIMKCGFLAVR